MTKEMELAKRIHDAWQEVYDPNGDGPTVKQMAVIAARVAMGKDETGKRDLIFEALCSAMGADWNGMPRSEQSRYNAATKQLREIGATPSDIIQKARRYEQLHPDWELTPTSLVSHWSSLSRGATQKVSRQIFPENDEPEVELVGPPPDFRLPVLKVMPGPGPGTMRGSGDEGQTPSPDTTETRN